MSENLGYKSGKMLEDEMLGEPGKESREKYKEYLSLLDQNTKFMDVVRVIETCQRRECIEPRKYFSRRLREEVAAQLNLDIKENPYNVQFYNAVSTVLDYKFGTDAFLAIKEPNSDFNARITLDLTTNATKDRHKANVITFFPEGSLDETNKEEREKLEEIIHHTAELVCEEVAKMKERYFKSDRRAA